jgi:hypothetical protein
MWLVIRLCDANRSIIWHLLNPCHSSDTEEYVHQRQTHSKESAGRSRYVATGMGKAYVLVRHSSKVHIRKDSEAPTAETTISRYVLKFFLGSSDELVPINRIGNFNPTTAAQSRDCQITSRY